MSQQTTNPKDFGPGKGRTVNTSRDVEQALIRMAKRKSRKGYRAAQILAYGSATAVIALVGINLANAANNSQIAQQLSKQVSDTYNPAYKVRFDSLGEQVIYSYYNNLSTPVNLAKGITWPGSSAPSTVSVAPATQTTANALPSVAGVSFLNGSRTAIPGLVGQYQEHLSYYAIVNGVPSVITLALASSDALETTTLPTLLSLPSIERAIPSSSVDISNKPQGGKYKDIDSKALSSQVDAWAKAWVSSDSSGLKQITQDKSEDSYYAGIGSGWEYVPNSSAVAWSVSKDATTAYAEVTFQMKVPDSQAPDTSAGSDGQSSQTITGPTQTQRMDLMITGYDTGLPAIVAWGDAGTYLSLTATSNVLTASQFKALPVTPTNS